MSRDIDKKKKREKAQKQSKIRSIMTNVVGAGAAVAVAVVAFSSSVEAYFKELFIFEDTIFYTVEVIESYDEENGEPENLPIRLVVEDQFDTVYIDLSYGESNGEINGLTANNVYTFKIQIRKDIGWITLESEDVSTYEDLSGAVYELEMDENYTEAVSDLTFGVYVQEGIEVLSDLYLDIEYNGVLLTFPLEYGDQKVTLESFNYTTLTITASIYAQIEDGELVELHSKDFQLRPYFDSSIAFDYKNDMMHISIEEKETPFNSIYRVIVYKEGKRIDSELLNEPLTSVSVEPYQTYRFEVYGVYGPLSYLLVEYEMETQTPPFAIIQVLEGVSGYRLTVNVFEYDFETYNGLYVIIDEQRYDIDLYEFLDSMYVFQDWVPIFEGSLTIYLEINDQPDVEYILETIGE